MPFFVVSKQYTPVVNTQTMAPKHEFPWHDILALFDPNVDLLVFEKLKDAKIAVELFVSFAHHEIIKIDTDQEYLSSLAIFEFDSNIDLSKKCAALSPSTLANYTDINTIDKNLLQADFKETDFAKRVFSEYAKGLFVFIKVSKQQSIIPTYRKYPISLVPIRVHLQNSDGKFVAQDIIPEVINNAKFNLQPKTTHLPKVKCKL